MSTETGEVQIAKRKKIPFLISELKVVEERKFNIPGSGKNNNMTPKVQGAISSRSHLSIK
jgi:hypothetical protein